VILSLSLVSCQGLWILTDDEATRVIASEAWTDTESFGLNAGVTPALERILQHTKLSEVKRIGVVTGPGAFTGLRIASSFAQGLARACGATLFSIPTFALEGKPFCIPLQHQKARDLDLPSALLAKMEVLEIRGPRREDAEVRLLVADDPVQGLAPAPFWPTPEKLLAGARRSKDSAPGLAIVYGLEPKISGKRTP